MRLLLDENLPRGLKRHLHPHTVLTVQEMGWNGIKNGHLLTRAQAEIQVLITIDGNMIYQQHVASFAIGLIVLHAPSNDMDDLLPLVADILSELPNVKPGEVIHVGDWGRQLSD